MLQILQNKKQALIIGIIGVVLISAAGYFATSTGLFKGDITTPQDTSGSLVIEQGPATGELIYKTSGGEVPVKTNPFQDSSVPPGEISLNVIPPTGYEIETVKDSAQNILSAPYIQTMPEKGNLAYLIKYKQVSAPAALDTLAIEQTPVTGTVTLTDVTGNTINVTDPVYKNQGLPVGDVTLNITPPSGYLIERVGSDSGNTIASASTNPIRVTQTLTDAGNVVAFNIAYTPLPVAPPPINTKGLVEIHQTPADNGAFGSITLYGPTPMQNAPLTTASYSNDLSDPGDYNISVIPPTGYEVDNILNKDGLGIPLNDLDKQANNTTYTLVAGDKISYTVSYKKTGVVAPPAASSGAFEIEKTYIATDVANGNKRATYTVRVKRLIGGVNKMEVKLVDTMTGKGKIEEAGGVLNYVANTYSCSGVVCDDGGFVNGIADGPITVHLDAIGDQAIIKYEMLSDNSRQQNNAEFTNRVAGSYIDQFGGITEVKSNLSSIKIDAPGATPVSGGTLSGALSGGTLSTSQSGTSGGGGSANLSTGSSGGLNPGGATGSMAVGQSNVPGGNAGGGNAGGGNAGGGVGGGATGGIGGSAVVNTSPSVEVKFTKLISLDGTSFQNANQVDLTANQKGTLYFKVTAQNLSQYRVNDVRFEQVFNAGTTNLVVSSIKNLKGARQQNNGVIVIDEIPGSAQQEFFYEIDVETKDPVSDVAQESVELTRYSSYLQGSEPKLELKGIGAKIVTNFSYLGSAPQVAANNPGNAVSPPVNNPISNPVNNQPGVGGGNSNPNDGLRPSASDGGGAGNVDPDTSSPTPSPSSGVGPTNGQVVDSNSTFALVNTPSDQAALNNNGLTGSGPKEAMWLSLLSVIAYGALRIIQRYRTKKA